jgi:capsular polysaccharide biosynthesis protein
MQVEPRPLTPPEADRARPLRRLVPRAWPWLVAAIAAAGATVAQLATANSAPTYESTGSYVVQPRAADDVTNIQATALLNGSVRIDATFARIAESELVRERAVAQLSPSRPDAEVADAEVVASLAPSANIVSISARTTDPDAAQDLAVAAGSETISYIGDLADLYDLTVLDAPGEAHRSASADVAVMPVLAAGVVGLGIGTATRPLVGRGRARRGADARPELDTSIDSVRYTQLRLQEEQSRTDSGGAPFHVLVLEPDLPMQGADIPNMIRVLTSVAREEDHVGHLRHLRPSRFVVVLADRTDAEVAELVTGVATSATERLRRRYGSHAVAKVYSCKYEHGAFAGDPEAISTAETS